MQRQMCRLITQVYFNFKVHGLQNGWDMQSKLQPNVPSSNTDDQMKEEAQVWDGIITDKLHPRKIAVQPHYRKNLNGQLWSRHVYSKK